MQGRKSMGICLGGVGWVGKVLTQERAPLIGTIVGVFDV